ncbi:MAG: IS200/IS605 family transposase [Prevotellaceae bacterium]|nr:IS200/IS605 family transposase [Prevotellaceae bacterium]
MANTYTQCYFHLIFSVKNRMSLLDEMTTLKLYPYIAGACKSRGHSLIAIGGMPDHIHLLVSMAPTEGLSAFVQSIKIQATKWIHENTSIAYFSWQSGYAAFSYSRSLLPKVEEYINNQKEHHRKHSFDEEIRAILDKSGIDYNENFILRGV